MANVCVKTAEDSLEKSLAEMLVSKAFKKPSAGDKIFKDECMYCFKTPFHQGGLFLCLYSFVGLCDGHLHDYCEITSRKVFLHIKDEKIEKKVGEPKDKITKLAIGVEGGFSTESDHEVKSSYLLVLHPDVHQKIKLDRLSGNLLDVCETVIRMDGAQQAERLEAGVNIWDGEAKIITKHAELVQLENGVKIPMVGWKCQEDGCDLTENLWLNLTDGVVKCGRSQFIKEGTISKGKNHMRIHFDKTGYPLVVKLGTITSNDADVFSYDEDESVCDPHLKKHLAHFGFDMDSAQKTEKSTLEMELDLNQKWEWAMCQEDGENLELAFGPGFTGMINIGSSCYINSAVQMLLQIPDFQEVYGYECKKLFSKIGAVESHNDFNCQFAKVISSLLSGEFSKRGSDLNCIKPLQFRRIVGKNHTEFSTARQQDVDEYIRHLLSIVDDKLEDGSNPVDSIRFKMEHRLKDIASGKVRYDSSEELILSLTIPHTEEPEDAQIESSTGLPIRRTISFMDCIEHTFSNSVVSEFKSPVTNESKGALHSYGIETFPDHLIVQMKRFYLDDKLNVKKMNVNISVPEEIFIGSFKARGQRPGEELLPRDVKSTLAANPEIVSELCSMGFAPDLAERAAIMTKNMGTQAASIWLMDHPADDSSAQQPDSKPQSDDSLSSAVQELTALGFTPHQARYALKQKNNAIDAAADWLFTNADSVPPDSDTQKSFVRKPPKYSDGFPDYRLIGFISHMGNSPHSGHYVTHLKKNKRWYLFNDEKVAISSKPPTALGYIYLFKRAPESKLKGG